jgi:hypothetical protein
MIKYTRVTYKLKYKKGSWYLTNSLGEEKWRKSLKWGGLKYLLLVLTLHPP